jgi:hypothetical protein
VGNRQELFSFKKGIKGTFIKELDDQQISPTDVGKKRPWD